MKVLLIDLENCPSQLNELLDNLANYSQVVICYAQSGAKIPIDWILPLTKVVNDNHLKIIKMSSVGKNAADFGIAFYAGVLMAKTSKKTHFDIVSNDTDLDFVIDLLNAKKRTAKRIGKTKKEELTIPIEPIKEIKAPVKAIEISNTVVSKVAPLQEYCTHLANYPNSKPSKESTLLNSIKSKLKDTVVPNELLTTLIKQGVVMINNGKVTYNQQKINTLKIK